MSAPASAAAPAAAAATAPPDSFEAKLFINNELVDGVRGEWYDLIDPCTEKPFGRVVEACDEDVDIAAKAATRAFSNAAWKKMSAANRGLLMYKLADRIEQNAEELARIEALNTGKAYAETSTIDVPGAVRTLRYFAGMADKICGMTVPADPDFLCMTMRDPIGVCGIIIPWNFPMMMLSWKLGPCLAAGNTCVVKPSEQSPLTALRLAQYAADVGFPPGVINIVTGHGQNVGAPLARHPLIKKIAFTGSTDVGHMIMGYAAGKPLKRVSLELGGKNPHIIFADADLDAAIDAAYNGLFLNQGQACSAGSRLYVQTEVYDRVVKEVTKRARARRVGHPLEPGVEQGPLIDRAQFNKTKRYCEIGVEEGATLCCGGRPAFDKGFFWEPTVFSDVTQSMRIAREEIFGPVLSIIRFDTIDEVIEYANDTEYGLCSAVWTQDITKALRTAREIRAGYVWINTYNMVFVQLPFGGVGESGMHRDLSEYSIESYTELKSIVARL